MIFDAIGKTARRVVRYVGFRGAALLLFALAYIGIGVGVLGNPMRESGLLHTMLPEWFRVALWVGAGVFAIVSAVICPRWQSIGFGVLFVPPAQRALSYEIELVRDLLEHSAGPFVLAGGVALIAILIGGISVATSGSPRHRRIRGVWVTLAAAAALTALIVGVILAGMLSLRWVSGTAVYALFCALVMLISAWPEPPPVTHVEERAIEQGKL